MFRNCLTNYRFSGRLFKFFIVYIKKCVVLEIDDDSPKRSLCSAQIAQKKDILALQIELKISFIVLDCLSKTHSSETLEEEEELNSL